MILASLDRALNVDYEPISFYCLNTTSKDELVILVETTFFQEQQQEQEQQQQVQLQQEQQQQQHLHQQQQHIRRT